MKQDNKWLVLNLVSLALAIGSIILCFNGIQGWGWFLACSLLASVYPSSKKEDDDNG